MVRFTFGSAATSSAALSGVDQPNYRKLDYFKMTKMHGSPGDREGCSWFYRVIEEHVTAAISCTVLVPDLPKAAREFPQLSGLQVNPYYLAFKAVIDRLAQHQISLGITEPVDFIFDKEAEEEQCIRAWGDLKRNAREDIRLMMGDTPIFRDDKAVIPLQAADLYAYWVRSLALKGVWDGIEKLEFPWVAEREIPQSGSGKVNRTLGSFC